MPQYDKILEPSLFWFWNATSDRDELKRQLDEFCHKGIKSVYIHPMPDDFRKQDFFAGMEIEYLSDEYFQLVAYTCEQIHQREMMLWLYDEGGWPSGMAGGQVVRTNPDFGTWVLKCVNGKIEPSQFLPECKYPDLTNPDATRCFIESTHEKYRRFIGKRFGSTVLGIFTDEPRILGCLGTDTIPWSPKISASFYQQHGYELDSVMDKLFEDKSRNINIQKAHRDYTSTLSSLIAENYYKPISQWCRENNLLFEGHHTGDDIFSKHGIYFGHFFEQAKYYDVPGVDTIWRIIFPGKTGGNYVKLASSVARLYDKKYVVSESFNVYGAGLTLEQMRWIIAYQVVRGVNRIGFMPALYDASGIRRISTCNDISPLNPVWKDLDILIEQTRCITNFISDGKLKPRVGIFYRTELIVDNDLSSQFDLYHEQLCDLLFDNFVLFVFVSMDEVQNAEFQKGTISIGDISLSHIIIHAHDALEDNELAMFKKIAEHGIGISFLKTEQNRETSMKRYYSSFADLENIFTDKFASISMDNPVKGVNLSVSYKDNSAKLLFFNQNSDRVNFSFKMVNHLSDMVLIEQFVSDNLPDIFQPFGYSKGSYNLTMQPGQVRAFVAASGLKLPDEKRYKIIESKQLSGQWNIFEIESFIISDKIEINKEKRLAKCDTLGDYINTNADFSGSLLYQKTFKISADSEERLFINLGKLWYSAEIFMNGNSCGVRAWSPYIFDITDTVKTGENLLEIRVTNTLANQWARKDIREKDLSIWKNVYVEKATGFIDQSCHAGLAGPVFLLRYK